MARKRVVTRTIVTTEATVLCLDTESAEPFAKTVVLSGTFENDKDMLKAARKLIDNDTITACKVVDSEVKETLYGMDEDYFIAHARVLPPRSNTENDNTDTENK